MPEEKLKGLPANEVAPSREGPRTSATETAHQYSIRFEDGPRPADPEGEVPSAQAENQQFDLAQRLEANKSKFKIIDGDILNQQGISIGSFQDGLITMKPGTMSDHVAMLIEAGVSKVMVLPPDDLKSKEIEDHINRQLSLNVPSRDGSLGNAPAASAGKNLERIEALNRDHEQFLEKALSILQTGKVKNSFEEIIAYLKNEKVHSSNPSFREDLVTSLSSAHFNEGLAVLKDLALSGTGEVLNILTRPIKIYDFDHPKKSVNILQLVDQANKNKNLDGYVINGFGMKGIVDVLTDLKTFSMRGKPERTNGSEELPGTPATSRGDISSSFPSNVSPDGNPGGPSSLALRPGPRRRGSVLNFNAPPEVGDGDGGLTGQPTKVPGADHPETHGARPPMEPREGVFGRVIRTAAPASPDSGILSKIESLIPIKSLIPRRNPPRR
jgi:hypothetical protein